MTTEPPFNLLSEVRRYIATTTAEQVRQDILASDFEAYRGIGDRITFEDLSDQVATKFNAQTTFTDVIYPRAQITLRPYHMGLMSALKPQTELSSNYEKMPLAA